MRRFFVFAAGVALSVLVLSWAFAADSEAQRALDELYSVAPASAPSAEEFKASPVGLPEDMHVGTSKDVLSVEVGNVLVNPLPQRNNY